MRRFVVDNRVWLGLGAAFLCAGLVLGAFAGYQLWWQNGTTARQARDLSRQVRESWSARPTASPTPRPATAQPQPTVPGGALALLRIPAMSSSFEVVVASGVGDDVIDRGLVGHFPDTAAPGRLGNFALAGHRVSHGQPFRYLDRIRRGDQILVETREAVYTYVADNDPRENVVPPNAFWVIDPVPGKPRVRPDRARITLTTCASLWNSNQRMVVFGHLVNTTPKRG
jgi:sortase A